MFEVIYDSDNADTEWERKNLSNGSQMTVTMYHCLKKQSTGQMRIGTSAQLVWVGSTGRMSYLMI